MKALTPSIHPGDKVVLKPGVTRRLYEHLLGPSRLHLLQGPEVDAQGSHMLEVLSSKSDMVQVRLPDDLVLRDGQKIKDVISTLAWILLSNIQSHQAKAP